MPEPVPVITVDGTAGSGKGTLARGLAEELGWHFLDSGALYRAFALAVLDAGAEPTDADACLQAAEGIDIETRPGPDAVRLWLGGVEVSARIRETAVGRAASQVSKHPPVRAALLDLQRAARRAPGLVADGRDMGSVVFPDAAVKLHLTASVEVRARRRQAQLKEMGISATLDTLIEELNQRDLQDTQRGVSPLIQAPDACLIDSSELSVAQVNAKARACLPGRFTRFNHKGTHP